MIRGLCALALAGAAIAQTQDDAHTLADLRARIDVLQRRRAAGERAEAPWPEIAAAVTASWTHVDARSRAIRLLAAALQLDDDAATATATALERTAALPELPPAIAARAWLAAGEIRFRGDDFAAAGDCFARAQTIVRTKEPPLACHAAARAFEVHLAAADLLAAKADIDFADATATTALERVRTHRQRAAWALRAGLLATAAADLQALHGDPAQDEYERFETLRLETDLALLREDLPAARAAATAVLASQQAANGPNIAQLARLKLLQIDGYEHGAATVVAPLRAMLADPAIAPGNRARVAAALVEHLLLAGSTDEAEAAAAQVRADRPFPDLADDELIAVAWAALARAPAHDAIDGATAASLRELQAALDERWQRTVAAWSTVAAEHEAVAFLQLPRRRALLSLCLRARRVLDPAGAPAAALAMLAQCEALGATARRLGLTPPLTMERVQALLPPDGACVAWLPANVGSHALVVDRSGCDLLPVPGDRGLRQHVRALRQVVRTSDAAFDAAAFLADATAASDIVLPPELLQRVAAAHSLALVGRELLAGLPFECLPTGRGATPWLGVERALTDVPSLLVAAHLAARPQPSAPTTVTLRAVAGTQVAPADAARWQLAGASITAADLQTLAAPFRAEYCELRLAATAADLAGAPPALLCVFAHGVHDATRVDPTGFVLGAAGSTPGAVFPADLEHVAAGRVTLLGVCGAGRVPVLRGEDGDQRLGTSCLLAGAEVVAVGDGDLTVGDALLAARELAAGLAQGIAPAEAMRRFRAAAVEQGRTHPAHWASLHLEGCPQPRLPAPARAAGGSLPVVALAAAAAILAALAAVARQGRKSKTIAS